MKRQPITNGNGQWFDIDSATVHKHETFFNGRNTVSKATGSQFDHEWLFETKSGKWVLNKFSDYQGSQETFEIISEQEAVEWFLRQGKDLPEKFESKASDYEV